MRCTKFNGLLAEVAKSYPNIDLVGFLSQKLELPIDKAEILAARIEKELPQQDKLGLNMVKRLLEKHAAESTSEEDAYLVECLSGNEFSYFIRWLLEELGFEVLPEKYVADFGVDFLAAKNGEKLAFLARRYPKTFKVTDTITLIAQEAKRTYSCDRVVVVTTTFFSPQAVVEAQKREIELWDANMLSGKIVEVKKKADTKEPRFPQYQNSLLQSLQRLVETRLFTIEPKAGEKYDLFIPWIKYPLLTYQTNSSNVTRCLYRIKYNNPVTESEGETLICTDRAGNRLGPNDEQAYTAILQYLEQFLE